MACGMDIHTGGLFAFGHKQVGVGMVGSLLHEFMKMKNDYFEFYECVAPPCDLEILQYDRHYLAPASLVVMAFCVESGKS